MVRRATRDRMDVLPEQKEYEPGDMARFQVRMPFRSATALVTVEREGVIESFVTRSPAASPVDRGADRATTMRRTSTSRCSRCAAASPAGATWLADLARKLGLSWRSKAARPPRSSISTSPPIGSAPRRSASAGQPHRLDGARSRRHGDLSRARARRSSTSQVARANGERLPAGAEIALAAVDEALLELAPNEPGRCSTR